MNAYAYSQSHASSQPHPEALTKEEGGKTDDYSGCMLAWPSLVVPLLISLIRICL